MTKRDSFPHSQKGRYLKPQSICIFPSLLIHLKHFFKEILSSKKWLIWLLNLNSLNFRERESCSLSLCLGPWDKLQGDTHLWADFFFCTPLDLWPSDSSELPPWDGGLWVTAVVRTMSSRQVSWSCFSSLSAASIRWKIDLRAADPGARAFSSCLASRLSVPRRLSRSDNPPSEPQPPSEIPLSDSEPFDEDFPW